MMMMMTNIMKNKSVITAGVNPGRGRGGGGGVGEGGWPLQKQCNQITDHTK